MRLGCACESRFYSIPVFSLFYFQSLRKLTAAALNCIPDAKSELRFPQKAQKTAKSCLLGPAYPLLCKICEGFKRFSHSGSWFTNLL
jgi:hypothetical protein